MEGLNYCKFGNESKFGDLEMKKETLHMDALYTLVTLVTLDTLVTSKGNTLSIKVDPNLFIQVYILLRDKCRLNNLNPKL